MYKATKLLNMIAVLSLLAGLAEVGLRPAQVAAAEPGRAEIRAARTLTAPVIDGRLDESFWNVSEPLAAHTDPSASDDSRFGLLWDDTYLYIGVRIEDDTPISGASGYWFDQDSLHLFFDPALHRSSPFAQDDMQIGLLYAEGSSTPEFRFGAALNNHAGKDERKVLRAIQATPEGWTAELAVPWDMLNTDPRLNRQLGLEVGVTNRYDAADTAKQRTSYWSAYNTMSFWNDTSGYGVVNLDYDSPVSGAVDPVLFQENFDDLQEGNVPPGWISDVNAGSPAFRVVHETATVTGDTYSVTDTVYQTYQNGRLRFDGNGAGLQARITAPVQSDNYTVEADVRIESVLNGARWAALMFRVPANGKAPYNQMAVRQNGTYEFAYRKPDNNWSVPANGTWRPLELGEDYTMKVRVFGKNVKEYIKAKDDADFTLLMDRTLESDLLERGKVGFQADQMTVSFDNLKVTRITADRLDLNLPAAAEALAGPLTVTGTVYFSDGLEEPVTGEELKFYSSDESVVKIVDNQPVPLKEGEATITAVYHQAEASQAVRVTPSLTGAKVLKLAHDTGYLLADAGTPVKLATVTFTAESSDYSTAEITGDVVEWSDDGGGLIRVDGGELTAERPGVYEMKVRKDNAELSLIVVVKAAEDGEYVLYEENFDRLADGAFPEAWTRLQGASEGKAGVWAGAFEMQASASPDNPSRVLLPDYLKLFGNYTIEADITNAAANNSGRWNSIMFRIQDEDYPYYQMAVRKDPSAYNGVEFAERTASNQWNVMERGSYTEPMQEGQALHYTVKAFGNRVQEWVDELMMIDSLKATAYDKGGIGFQADGSDMRIDNIRVTLLEQPLPAPAIEPFIKVAEPETRIAMAPTIVTDIASQGDLAKLTGSQLPATAIFHLNAELSVTEPGGGREIASLEEALAAAGDKVIPAFYVTEELAVDRLVHELRARGLEDVFIVSERADLVKRARAAYPMIRGILDFTSIANPSREELLDIRRQTAASQARIALLPQSAATRENVSYLQKLAIMVWSKEAPDSSGGVLPLHRMITAGVNGLVAAEPAEAHEALKLYGRDTTLVRKVYMIGHRGMPSVSPENTIESNTLALDAGADYIENDMFLTKDGYLIISHSSVLETTTDGYGPVENHTLAELKAFNANKPYPQGFPVVRMPTLDEQLELARARGRMVYAEIKTETPAAVDAFVSTVKKHNAEDIVNVMSFYPAQLDRLAVLMPEMNAGLLTGYIASENNVEGSLRDTLKALSKQNWTYNTDYNGLGPKFMEAAKHRGLLISPWTLNKREDIVKYFKMGAFGITTDYTYYASDWAASLAAREPVITLNKGESRTLSAQVETYKGDKTEVAPEVVLLAGADAVQADGATVKAVGAGKAYALLRYSAAIDGGGTYDLYSEPVEIAVNGGGDSGGEPPGGGGDNNGGGNNGGGNNSGGNNGGGGNGGNNGNNGGGSGNGGSSGGGSPGNSSAGGTNSGNSGAPETGGVSQPGQAEQTGVMEAAGGAVSAAELEQAFRDGRRVEVRFTGERLTLPLSALAAAAGMSGAELTAVNTELNAGYRLPLRQLDAAQAARVLGVNADALELIVTVRGLDGAEAEAVRNAADRAGGTLAGPVVEFGLQAADRSSKSAVPFALLGSIKYIGIKGNGNTMEIAGARYDTARKALAFTPGRYAADTSEVVLTHGGNGIYTAVAMNKDFADMNGHWAEAAAEKLANRLLLSGTGGGAFEPDRAVTRAEFAAMLVRALGLSDSESTAASEQGAVTPALSDVGANDWFAPYVRAASAAGLVSGYADGTFRPDAPVTRGEQAVMMARAIKLAGFGGEAAAAGGSGALERFRDASEVKWGQAEWSLVLEAGLFNGISGNRLAPAAPSSRAQSAVILDRFLEAAGFLE